MNLEIDKKKYIDLNRSEYGDLYPAFRFPMEAESRAYRAEREQLLGRLSPHVRWDYQRTKADTTRISPGCRLCGDGYWSCLFVNNRCNAACFYCPAKQTGQALPGTSSLDFPEPEDYADYVQALGFRGVSISGGEPLLDFAKSVRFIEVLRKRFGRELYLWLYSNGICADKEKLQILADAGLDEIRFDISATAYSLTKVARAAGIIPHITVEIPAIPEDVEIVQNLLPQMVNIGVNYLNLHQIRVTRHNAPQLIARGYTFLHGPKITVLESELTALRLLLHAREKRIALPINYCSFIYRHRFQTRAARRRHAALIKQSYEDITEAGLIRTMGSVAVPDRIQYLTDQLSAANIAPENWYYSPAKSTLYFSQAVLNVIFPLLDNLHLDYHVSLLLPSVSYRRSFREIALNERRVVIVERAPVLADIELNPVEMRLFYDTFLKIPARRDLYRVIEELVETQDLSPQDLAEHWRDIYFYEKIKTGLYEYY